MADSILKETEKKTAFNPEKQPKRVGDFNITKMTLTSANLDIDTGAGANFLDLTTSVWHELNFYEDIYLPVVIGVTEFSPALFRAIGIEEAWILSKDSSSLGLLLSIRPG